MSGCLLEKGLNKSNLTEKEVARLIKSRNPNILNINVGDGDSYGLEVIFRDGSFKYLTVKEDFMCAKTGNVAVEYRSGGEISGISTTKADIWIYKIHTKEGYELYGINTGDLKKSINRGEFFRKAVGGEPGSNTMMYLYKYDKFKTMCRRL